MKTFCTLLFFALLTGLEPVSAQYFIRFEGVDGESRDRDHQNWSDLISFEQSINAQTLPAAGAIRRRGAVTFGDLVCTKELDKASPKLAEAVAMGKVFPKVEIHAMRTFAGGERTTYYVCEMKNVVVSGYSIAGSSPEERPVETFSLNFEEIKVIYTEVDQAGRKKGNVEYTWKVAQGKN